MSAGSSRREEHDGKRPCSLQAFFLFLNSKTWHSESGQHGMENNIRFKDIRQVRRSLSIYNVVRHCHRMCAINRKAEKAGGNLAVVFTP